MRLLLQQVGMVVLSINGVPLKQTTACTTTHDFNKLVATLQYPATIVFRNMLAYVSLHHLLTSSSNSSSSSSGSATVDEQR
jgi:hypothetical protein